MKRIFKYNIPAAEGTHFVRVPVGTKILHVGEQYNNITLWAEVDTEDQEAEKMFLRVVYTGDEPPSSEVYDYLGTVLLDKGCFVVHVYAIKSKQPLLPTKGV